jgi:hypothetical protein
MATEFTTTPASSPDGTPLVTLERARQSPVLAKITDDDTLTELLLGASSRIEDFLGRKIMLMSRTELYDGSTVTGVPVTSIALRSFPVIALDSIAVLNLDATYANDAFTIPTSDVTVDQNRGIVAFVNYGLVAGYWHYFPRGLANLQITYTAGFATVPAVIRQATVALAIRMWTVARRDPSEAAEKLGNYSVNYRFNDDMQSDLPPDISGAISRYRDWRA